MPQGRWVVPANDRSTGMLATSVTAKPGQRHPPFDCAEARPAHHGRSVQSQWGDEGSVPVISAGTIQQADARHSRYRRRSQASVVSCGPSAGPVAVLPETAERQQAAVCSAAPWAVRWAGGSSPRARGPPNRQLGMSQSEGGTSLQPLYRPGRPPQTPPRPVLAKPAPRAIVRHSLSRPAGDPPGSGSAECRFNHRCRRSIRT
jgi:hypothetical protein